MQILRDFGYSPQLRSCMPRITPNGYEASETWAVDLADRMPIPQDDPVPATEISKPDTINPEVAGFRAYFAGKDKV
jgi:hypothetical protein